MVLPDEQAEMDKFIARQLAKPPGEPIEPYQKTFSFDIDKLKDYLEGSVTVGGVASPATATTKTDKVTTNQKGTTVQQTTVTKPVSGTAAKGKGAVATGNPTESPYVFQEPDQVVNYGNVLRKTTQDYIEQREGGLNQKKIYSAINGHNIQEPAIKNWIDQINKRLALHDQQNGIETIKIADNPLGPPSGIDGDKAGTVTDSGMYPTELNYEVLPDGTIVLKDQIPEFAAKVALANYDGDYVVKGKKYFDEAAYKRDWEAKKDNAEILLKGAKAQTERAKAGWYWGKLNDLKDDEKKTKMISDGYVENLISQPSLITSTGKPNEFSFTISNQTTTPFLTLSESGKPVILKPIGGSPIYEQVNGESTNKVIGYKNGYYEQTYLANGVNIPDQELVNRYNKDFKNAYSEEQRQQWGITSLDAWLKYQIKAGNFDVKLVGANGATTQAVHTQTLKKALGTTKNYTEFYSENETPEQ